MTGGCPSCCGTIGHKTDACIIRGPKFLSPSLIRNINQFNALHGEEPNEPPREWNSQHPAGQLKPRNPLPNTIPVVSAITRILNHNSIDNGDVEVCLSDFPVEFNPESVPDPGTTPIKSFGDDEMDHLMEIFHSEHDKDILYFNAQTIQD